MLLMYELKNIFARWTDNAHGNFLSRIKEQFYNGMLQIILRDSNVMRYTWERRYRNFFTVNFSYFYKCFSMLGRFH